MKNKNALLLVVGALFVALQFSSCAALMRYKCNKEFAAKKGMEDAENGRTAMPGRLEGGNCDSGGDYSASDFSKDYNYGFLKKKDEVCQASTAAGWGRADGEAGNGNRPSKTKLRLCEDRGLAKLESIFEKEFVKSFCAPARAQKLGRERAQSWQPADFETAFQPCKSNVSGLKGAYNSAYRDAMAEACTVEQAKKNGHDEAEARRPMEGVKGRLGACTVGNKAELIAAFEQSYNIKKKNMDDADAVRAAEAAEAARKAKIAEFQAGTATTTFPYQLRNYAAFCNVSGDRSFVQVDVQNSYPEQILIQGFWKISYYNQNFEKITEDRTQEAVLITGGNRKSFQKMTLPKDASFCRAEYMGRGATAM